MEKDKKKLLEVFEFAFTETVNTVTGLTVEKIEVDSLSNLSDSNIIGAMMLIGDNNALLTITASTDTLRLIISYMTGIDVDELDENILCDGIAEIVNMVSGSAKVKLIDTNYAFNLSTPFAVKGNNLEIMVKKSVHSVNIVFEVDNMKLNLTIYYF